MLQVTRSYLPPKEQFLQYIDKIWESHVLTNNGSFVQALEDKLKQYTGCKHVLACANGTIVLQMALRAMNITKEVITTPFSYVATTNAILWEKCKPVFVDITKKGFTIDASKIEKAITKNTQAILATHVYGYPCDVERIQKIAKKYDLKVIYDAANSFGTIYKDKSVFSYGDISTCSFHATKLFHTAEGGALFVNNEKYFDPLFLFRSFGHIHDDYYSIGINAKMSELHAVMGLCNLDHMDEIIAKRKEAFFLYNKYLDTITDFKTVTSGETEYNYTYYPVLVKDEQQLMLVMSELKEEGIFPRRYFYPSLNLLPFLKNAASCPVSENISRRVLCLPLSVYITEKDIQQICGIINKVTGILVRT